MRKIAFFLLALLSAAPAFGQGGIANFPQTVPPNTLVGRLGITPGPTSAIPISQLAAVFGASRSFTVNAKCDGSTNDTTAINADLAQGGYWTIPPGRTCNVTQINITQSGTRISGAGFNSSAIQGTTANAPTINISATLSSVYLDGFQVTKSVTATSGGNGIKFNGDCQYCVIDGVYTQKSWVGIAAQSTGIGYMRHVLSQYNLSDGITFTNSAISGTLQWDLDDVFSGQNAGRGYIVAPGVAGPTSITLGSWHNVRTFANTGPGIAIACSVSIPCNGFRLTKGLLGQDNNHEIFLDTYGGLHSILDTYVELAGTSPTGPTFSTPAANTGDGVRITANNLDVSIGSLYANGNHDSGINTSATVSTNVNGVRISNHGINGILAADCAKLIVTSINFVTNGTNINCTTNNGSQQVVTSTPASLNNVIAATNANMTGDVTSVGNATTIAATKVTSAMLNANVFSTAHSWSALQTLAGISTASAPLLAQSFGSSGDYSPAQQWNYSGGTGFTFLTFWNRSAGDTAFSSWGLWNSTNDRWEYPASSTYGTALQTFNDNLTGNICYYTANTGGAVVAGNPITFNRQMCVNGSGGVSFGGGTFVSPTTATTVQGEVAFPKITASGSAPGAGFLKIEAVAGTNAGSCKIIAYAGTSTTPVTIIDNVGSGC